MLFIGTSSYSFKEWVGPFYPPKTPASQYLGYYSSKLNSVEINYTYRHFPTEKLSAAWAAGTPETFAFSLKMHQGITHLRRLKDVEKPLNDYLRNLKPLAGGDPDPASAQFTGRPRANRSCPGPTAGRSEIRLRVPPSLLEQPGDHRPVAEERRRALYRRKRNQEEAPLHDALQLYQNQEGPALFKRRRGVCFAGRSGTCPKRSRTFISTSSMKRQDWHSWLPLSFRDWANTTGPNRSMDQRPRSARKKSNLGIWLIDLRLYLA
jgi:hypothetical protein